MCVQYFLLKLVKTFIGHELELDRHDADIFR